MEGKGFRFDDYIYKIALQSYLIYLQYFISLCWHFDIPWTWPSRIEFVQLKITQAGRKLSVMISDLSLQQQVSLDCQGKQVNKGLIIAFALPSSPGHRCMYRGRATEVKLCGHGPSCIKGEAGKQIRLSIYFVYQIAG